MNGLVFYCLNCKQSFVGENYLASDRPPCPKCSKRTQSTGFTKELWVQKTKEERTSIINTLVEEIAVAELQAEPRQKETVQKKTVGSNCEENVDTAKGSWLDGLYTDIGKRIKVWAKWIFIVEAIASVIGAIMMLFTAENGAMFFAALLALILGPMLAWVSSWLLYAFGELVDKTAANERNTQRIINLMLENMEQNK